MNGKFLNQIPVPELAASEAKLALQRVLDFA